MEESKIKIGTKLYGFSGWFTTKYFLTEKELIDFLNSNNTNGGTKCILEYLGYYKGKYDVIKKTFLDTGLEIIIVPKNYEYYYLYNKKLNEWILMTGDFINEYDAFRKIGTLQNDVYNNINNEAEEFSDWFESQINHK